MENSAKKKIYIIDDDNFLLDMYSLKFTQSGFEVYTASSGAEALEKLKGGLVPDVILIDVMMPIMDGFEFFKKMNDEKASPDSIKIILSNLGLESDIAEGQKLGADGYIVKSSATPADVVEKVIEIMSRLKKAGSEGGR